jgi:hypothetical protein
MIRIVTHPCKFKIRKEITIKDRTGSGNDYNYKEWYCLSTGRVIKKRECKNCKRPKI